MKSLSSGLLAHYAGTGTTIASCWKVTRRDAQVFGFTDHDRDLDFGGLVYAASTGYTGSQIETSSQLNVSNLDVLGFLDLTSFTASDTESGKWDGARFELFEVNYSDLTQGRNILLTGTLGPIQRRGQQWIATLHSLTSALQKNIGSVISPVCNAVFGDARCGFDLASITVSGALVSSVTSRLVLVSTDLISTSHPDGWFSFGTILFTTGANEGIIQDIKEFEDDGTITLQLAFPFEVEVGDEFTITPGCNKLLKTGDGVYDGDCKVKFDNVVNFRGDPEVPLLNKTLQLT